jgi:L-rhamnose mutarotase
VQRFGMMIKLKPGSEQAYKKLITPPCRRKFFLKFWNANIRRNDSIFSKDGFLFSYFEYDGNDLKNDWSKMAAHLKTQERWAIMQPLQEPLSTRREGEWWAEMEEVFHLR